MLRWVDEHAPDQFVDWYPFEHPQLGAVELGGWHHLGIWTNPPLGSPADEVTPHADFAVAQAMASPCVEIIHTAAVDLGGGTWRIEVGIANTGWLPTHVSARGAKDHLARPIVAEVTGEGVTVVGGPARCSSVSSLVGPHSGSPPGTTGHRTASSPRGWCGQRRVRGSRWSPTTSGGDAVRRR